MPYSWINVFMRAKRRWRGVCSWIIGYGWFIQMNRDLGCNSIPIEFAVFLLTWDFHADIVSEQIEFDPVYEIAELKNKSEAIIPTPSFYRQGNWGPGSCKYCGECNSCRDRKHSSSIQAWQYLIWVLFRKPYYSFFSVRKNVRGGNKMTVHSLRSI